MYACIEMKNLQQQNVDACVPHHSYARNLIVQKAKTYLPYAIPMEAY